MRKRVVSGFVLALSSGLGLVAQVPVYIVYGTASATRLGTSVCIAQDFDGVGGVNDVTLTLAAIPEPNSMAMLAASLGMSLGLQRFRRRRA